MVVKQRIGAVIAERIHEICSQIEEQNNIIFKGYLEPFCGMLGVYQHIPKWFKNHRVFRYQAGDINESVIKMWKALQQGWTPPVKCLEKRFYELKGNGQSSAEKGFVGHACSFRGVYFASYDSRITDKQILGTRKKITRISDILNDNKVNLRHTSYQNWKKLKGYIIYCDPPYLKGSNYRDEWNKYQHFDYDAFYKWAEQMAKNNLVFVSEQTTLPYTLVGTFGIEQLF